MTSEKSNIGYTKHVDGNDDDEVAQKILNNPKKKNCLCSDGFKVIVAGCFLFGLSVTIGLIVDIYTRPSYLHGSVSTDAEECSTAARSILQTGKANSVDAAVAAILCMAVVRPESFSLAGGGYMSIHSFLDKDEVIDFQFSAPIKATATMFNGSKVLASKGGLSIAVPGVVKGLTTAYEKHGKYPWAKLVQPAIDLAEKGFFLSQTTVDAVAANIDDLPDNIKDLFTDGSGRVTQAGALIKLPGLAKTLRAIAKSKSNAIYKSTLTEDLIKEVNRNGGILSEIDTADYKVLTKEPLTEEMYGKLVFAAPLPSSGILVLAALKVFKQFDTTKMSEAEKYHTVAEILKFIYVKRTLLADPDFEDMKSIGKVTLSDDEAKRIADLIKQNTTTQAPKFYGELYQQPNTPGSISVTVVSSDSSMVAMSGTIGSAFGAKLLTSSGIIMNNGMSSFSMPGLPAKAGIENSINNIKPGKRPFSAAAPIMIKHRKNAEKENKLWYSFASSGGAQIVASVYQVILNRFAYNLTDVESFEHARVYDQVQPDVLQYEGDRLNVKTASKTVEGLSKMGYALKNVKSIGDVKMAGRSSDKYVAMSDSRGPGNATSF